MPPICTRVTARTLGIHEDVQRSLRLECLWRGEIPRYDSKRVDDSRRMKLARQSPQRFYQQPKPLANMWLIHVKLTSLRVNHHWDTLSREGRLSS